MADEVHKCTYCGTEYATKSNAQSCATDDAFADQVAGIDTRDMKE